MVLTKNGLIKDLNKANDILVKHELGDSQVALDVSQEVKAVENFEAKVLMVGTFSAGKSALLNTFMSGVSGEEILKENISMETAIATELRYSEQAYAIKVKQDGSREKCSIEEAKSADPTGYLKYEFYLPIENLKKLENIVIVDMPGHSSGVKEHNKAIAQYINSAAGYVYVISSDNGTFDIQSQNFLREIQHYSGEIKYVLTKCDKHAKEDLNDIAEEIKDNIEEIVEHDVTLTKTSSRYSDAQATMYSLFSSFDPTDLLAAKEGYKSYGLLESTRGMLTEQKQALVLDTSEIDKKIAENEAKKASLAQRLEEKREEYLVKLKTQGTEKVVSKVEDKLRQNVSALVRAAKGGSNTFGNTVSSLIRPELSQATSDFMTATYGELLEDVTSGIFGDSNYVADRAGTLFGGLKDFGQKYAAKENSRIATSILAGLAIVTDFVAPVVELIILFIPEIVNFLTKNIQERKLREQIENEIIPQIVEDLRQKLPEYMEQVGSDTLKNIEDSINLQIDSANEAIQKLRDDKKEQEVNLDEKKQALDQSLNEIADMMSEMEKDLDKE